jgi:uncharacterized membrane protein YcfT
MKSLILFLIAYILAFVLFPLGFIYALVTFRASKSKYLFNLAFALDKLGNATLGVVMNDLLKKKGGLSFGNYDQTLSYCLGRNLQLGTLTRLGRGVRVILDWIDPNHCEKAVKSYNKRNNII